MRWNILVMALASMMLSACATDRDHSLSADASTISPGQEAAFERIKSLAGTWRVPDVHGHPASIQFEVVSGGSVVREIMLKGTPQEMTNMYVLDRSRGGIGLMHYCAVGNQPQMHSTDLNSDRMTFKLVRVHNASGADQLYMGELTLVFVDDDHLREEWSAFQGGRVDHRATFELTRQD